MALAGTENKFRRKLPIDLSFKHPEVLENHYNFLRKPFLKNNTRVYWHEKLVLTPPNPHFPPTNWEVSLTHIIVSYMPTTETKVLLLHHKWRTLQSLCECICCVRMSYLTTFLPLTFLALWQECTTTGSVNVISDKHSHDLWVAFDLGRQPWSSALFDLSTTFHKTWGRLEEDLRRAGSV